MAVERTIPWAVTRVICSMVYLLVDPDLLFGEYETIGGCTEATTLARFERLWR
jgi:hypothetical protein